MILRLFATAVTFGSLARAVPPAPPVSTSGADILSTFEDSCSRGVFSPSGRKALALCSGGEGAASAQLYEIDFANSKRRRVTWQDGVVGSADWIDEENVAYSSTTDELKELPFLKVKLPADNVPSEIYSSDRMGSRIHRLTKHPGFDGDLSVDRQNGDIIFVSREGAKQSIAKAISPNAHSSTVVAGEAVERRAPVRIPHGVVAWLEVSSSGKGVDLHTTDRKNPVRLRDRLLLSLRPAPSGSGWITVENPAPTKPRVLFVGLQPDCEKTLWEGPADARFADATSVPTPRLLISTVEGKRQRLLVKEIDADAFTCPPSAPATKVGP